MIWPYWISFYFPFRGEACKLFFGYHFSSGFFSVASNTVASSVLLQQWSVVVVCRLRSVVTSAAKSRMFRSLSLKCLPLLKVNPIVTESEESCFNCSPRLDCSGVFLTLGGDWCNVFLASNISVWFVQEKLHFSVLCVVHQRYFRIHPFRNFVIDDTSELAVLARKKLLVHFRIT